MEWSDHGIVLGTRAHGETGLIVEVMTRAHGRHLGLVRGGRGKRLSAVVQPGNSVDLVWRARIEEHLGLYAVEGIRLRAGDLIGSAAALYGLHVAAAHLRLLPERDPHEALFETLEILIEHLNMPHVAAALLVRFEVALLGELGFGINLAECAATGATQELIYVFAEIRPGGEPCGRRALQGPASGIARLPQRTCCSGRSEPRRPCRRFLP